MSGFGRRSVKKNKPPPGLHRRGFWNLSLISLTYFLPALVGALCTTRTTLFTRTTDTAQTLMTSAAVASAAANKEMVWASKENMAK